MQWKYALGAAVLTGALATSSPLAAQTSVFPSSAGQTRDTSWAARRAQMTQTIQRDMRELLASYEVAQQPAPVRSRGVVLGAIAPQLDLVLEAVTPTGRRVKTVHMVFTVALR